MIVPSGVISTVELSLGLRCIFVPVYCIRVCVCVYIDFLIGFEEEILEGNTHATYHQDVVLW